MKKMIHSRGNLILTAALFAAGIVGCSRPPDERLAEFAQQSMMEQSLQNQRMANQSQAAVAESHQLAEAAKALVASDAEARRELISAQQELTSQLNQRQSTIDTGHDRLEQDRRELAQQRHRDPIIASVIQNFGLWLACLLPLLVAVLVIRQMQSQEPDHAAVAELLMLELTSDQPRLLPDRRSSRPTVTHRKHEAKRKDEAHLEMITGNSTSDEVEPPF